MTAREPITRADVRAAGPQDVYLLREGTHARAWQWLGSHLDPAGEGAHFAVWAPNAHAVSVIGDWNGWDPSADALVRRRDDSGVWEGHAAEARLGHCYKYRVMGPGGVRFDKADPYALGAEVPPATASRLVAPRHPWGDDDWMRTRAARNGLDAPISIYEMHLGSWLRPDGRIPGYREIAEPLTAYLLRMGFTHVELMPVTEHPFYGSWGYQTTGYFAASSRYGPPEDLMFLVDHLHRAGIGVILDWVPSHFPTDEHGLQFFDGTHLYEHADPRQGFHPEWNSSIFNYGRGEVQSFLVSSALYWLEAFHLDGLRVDAVASMLYLDYARKHGEWIPNVRGGRENLEAVAFLRFLNETLYREHPDIVTIAEESTAWPRVSRPTSMDGLGFGMKWNMGWMHDTLAFMKEDPIHRQYHLGRLTFSLVYAFNENFVLPLSHDEVVYGKGSLLGKMPGDAWQQFANLRLLYGFMWTHPGKKLLFMGGEFGQGREWTHEGQLEWQQTELAEHRGIQRLVGDLNLLYRGLPALHARDFDNDGFEWIEANDAVRSVVAYLRRAPGESPVLVVCNFTPVPRSDYVLGVPLPGRWAELMNTDATDYGGSGWGNLGGVETAPLPSHGRPHSVRLTLPPLAAIVLRHEPPMQPPRVPRPAPPRGEADDADAQASR